MTFQSPRRVRAWAALAQALLMTALGGAAASAQPAGGAAPRGELAQDPVLQSLVAEGLRSRPELAQSQATVKADYDRVPQAGALPDPVVSLGIQNDGFRKLQIGDMETSWWSASAAQTFPWVGKRGLRARAQKLTARQSEADLGRARLTIQAEVERAYVDLLLVRDQLEILGKLETLWLQAEGLSRSRYESGAGAQSDILRAQLERKRLQQQRWALAAEERRRVTALDRAAGRPLGQPIATTLSLAEVRDPALPDSAQATADLLARSPELEKARLGVEQSGALVALARRDYLPDLTVSGGVMPRGGEFETMWQAGLSLPLPLWAGGKQSRAVRESRARQGAAESGAEALRRLALERLDERRALLAALLETNGLYRSGLLVQSEATVSSAMAQYQVGRVPFAAVLEALSGYFADQVGYYESVAATQRIDIAQRELSLDPVGGSSPSGLGGASLPGAGGMGAAAAPASATPPPAAGSGSSAMPRM